MYSKLLIYTGELRRPHTCPGKTHVQKISKNSLSFTSGWFVGLCKVIASASIWSLSVEGVPSTKPTIKDWQLFFIFLFLFFFYYYSLSFLVFSVQEIFQITNWTHAKGIENSDAKLSKEYRQYKNSFPLSNYSKKKTTARSHSN